MIRRCFYRFDRVVKMPVPSQEYMTGAVHSFDVFCHLILPFDYGLSVLNFPRSSVFLPFYLLHYLLYITVCELFLHNAPLTGLYTPGFGVFENAS